MKQDNAPEGSQSHQSATTNAIKRMYKKIAMADVAADAMAQLRAFRDASMDSV